MDEGLEEVGGEVGGGVRGGRDDLVVCTGVQEGLKVLGGLQVPGEGGNCDLEEVMGQAVGRPVVLNLHVLS